MLAARTAEPDTRAPARSTNDSAHQHASPMARALAGAVEQRAPHQSSDVQVVAQMPHAGRDFSTSPLSASDREPMHALIRAGNGLAGTHPWGRSEGSRSSKAERAADFQQQGGAAEAEGEILDQQGGGGEAAPERPGAGVEVADQQVSAGPSATFSLVRAATTPVGMAPDRIPPRVDFAVAVTVANWYFPMLPIVVSVHGSGGANGSATVNGNPTQNLFGSGSVQLRGAAQTTPGSAGGLRLTASFGGRIVGAGNRFSIAAIPQDMVLSGSSPLTGSERGFAVTQTWSSDSGVLADLDEVRVSEAVQYISSTGCFVGLGARNSNYIAASGGSLTDTHSTPVAALTGPGTRLANQTEMFLDNRTGVLDVPMRASGFTISRNVAPVAGVLTITTAKAGAAVTANGIASGAGSGSISLPQAV